MTHAMSKSALMHSHRSPALSPSGKITLAGRRVHFVGIGGCGMSGLARLAQQAGAVCSGSDTAPGETIDALRRDGIKTTCVQSAETVPDLCDLMVISAAIKPDHPEVQTAADRGIEVIKYAQLLGQLMIGRIGVAIAGTHGKSTTTSLLCHVLIESGLDPSFIVGANCPQIGGGSHTGRANQLLVAEACEFDRSFHNFHPTHAVILNVEEDHLDHYSDLDDIVASFAVFASKLPHSGSLLIQHDLPHRLAITANLRCSIQTIGYTPQADWRVEVTEHHGSAPDSTPRPPATVRLHRQEELVAQWANPLPGEHMAYNAAAAAVTAYRLGASWDQIAAAIGSFGGLDRRMQWLGTRRLDSAMGACHGASVTVVDDYGHHPTEVDTTLRALRSHYNPKRLICVFQPHQHSRTRFLMEQFAVSFAHADIVIVPHIYFVRDSENERHAVRAADLVDRLRRRRIQAMHLYPFIAIVEQLELMVRDGDLLVTMGAGDVWHIAAEFLRPNDSHQLNAVNQDGSSRR